MFGLFELGNERVSVIFFPMSAKVKIANTNIAKKPFRYFKNAKSPSILPVKKQPVKNQPSKKVQLQRLIRELDTAIDPKPLGDRIFQLLDLSKLQNYIPKISNKNLTLDFIKFLISRKHTSSSTASFYLCLLLSSKEQDFDLVQSIVKFLLDNHVGIQPKEFKDIYTALICNAHNQEYTLKIMDEIKHLEPLIMAKNDQLKSYFMKWSWLCCLDELEQVFGLSKNVGGAMIESVNSKHYIDNLEDLRVGDILSFKNNPGFANIDLSSLLKAHADQRKTIMDTLSPPITTQNKPNLFERILCTITSFSSKMRKYELKIHQDFTPQMKPVQFQKYGNLSPFKSQIDALITFATKGDSCTDTYDVLLGKSLPTRPAQKLAHFLQPSGLNPSQVVKTH